jgi:multidrug resistance protein MdtO
LPDGVRLKLADAVDQMAQSTRRGHLPPAVALELPEEASSSPLARDLLAAIRQAMTRFAEPDSAPPAPAKKTEKKGGFLADDAFTNPEHVQYALKTTAAAMFCYVLYSLLDWNTIHTSFLTCYIVAQSTAAESVEKLSLRITGCLIGGAAGIAAIVFLMPHFTSIGGLMITVFVGGWVGAYVAAGGERIGYAGLQMAFAFFLCVIQGSGPSFDMVTARDRIIGILLGNLVSYFAMVHVWPVTISRRVDPALAAAFRELVKVVSAKQAPERRLLVSQVQGSLTEIGTDIELAGYEPSSIRSSNAWRAARRHVVENTQSLSTLLLLSEDPRELQRVEAAPRLERLAAQLTSPSAGGAVAPSWVAQATHGWQTLPARINERLQALEEMLPPGVRATEASPHAPS